MATVKVQLDLDLSELQDLQYGLERSYSRFYSEWVEGKISEDRFKPIHDRLTTLQRKIDTALSIGRDYREAVETLVHPI